MARLGFGVSGALALLQPLKSAFSWILSLFTRTYEISPKDYECLRYFVIKHEHLKYRSIDYTEDTNKQRITGTSFHYVERELIKVCGLPCNDNNRYGYTVTCRRGLDLPKFLRSLYPVPDMPRYDISYIRKESSYSGLKTVLPPGSVFVEPGVEKIVMNALDYHYSTETVERYKRLGQPHTLVFLLHGLPGTGKTRFVNMLAGKYGKSLSLFPIGQKLWGCLDRAVDDSLILIDELDKSLESDGNMQEKIGKLSSFLDGGDSPSDAVIFLVANDISKIPPVITRTRRIHYIVKFEEFSSDLIARAGNYWTEGKMTLTRDEVSSFNKKFVGAHIIQILDDLDREKKLTKEEFINRLSI
jgi:hypothetical protein